MVINRQKRVRVKLRALDEFLGRAAARLHLPSGAATICLVSNAQIARWNGMYRGKRGPTDVLSFPLAENGSRRNAPPLHRGKAWQRHEGIYLGDIAIAPAVVRRNARTFGRTFDCEMRILALHGLLHLMGYDHETDSGAMDRIESRLRCTLGLA